MVLDDFRALPKVQLHCHLEGTIGPATFRELALRHSVDIGRRSVVPLEETYQFTSFGEFLLLFAEVCKALSEPDDFARIAREYAEGAAVEGVMYSELFISPSVWHYFHPNLDVPGAVAAIRRALDETVRSGGPRVELIADLTRNFGPEQALASVREAAHMQDAGVIGIGLGGDETRFPPELFAEAYAAARRAGLRTVAHAGEAAGPASVRRAIEDLGAERIGHGVRALDDPLLIADLVRWGTPLEICPTSNRLTGAVGAGDPHPIEELDRLGVTCVVDADDPALFGTSVVEEYGQVAALMGMERTLRLARQAIDASFAPEADKVSMRERFDRHCAESLTARRRG